MCGFDDIVKHVIRIYTATIFAILLANVFHVNHYSPIECLMPGQPSKPSKTLELLADEIADGARISICLHSVQRNFLADSSLWDQPQLQCAQAPACRLGSLARAAVEDGAGPQSLRDAAKVHHSHGERDAHRIFNKYWMSLRVPIDDLKIGPLDEGQYVSIPHYKVLGQIFFESQLSPILNSCI